MSIPSSAFGPSAASITTDTKPRCTGCGRLLAEIVTRPWLIRCSRCKVTNLGFLPHQEDAMRSAAESIESNQAPQPSGARLTEPHRGQSRASSQHLSRH